VSLGVLTLQIPINPFFLYFFCIFSHLLLLTIYIAHSLISSVLRCSVNWFEHPVQCACQCAF
jgi:hypothetical protein